MSEPTLSALDVSRVVRKHLGQKVTRVSLQEDGSVAFVLYEAFAFGVYPDDYGSGNNWGIGLKVGGDVVLSTLLGRRLTILTFQSQIEEALDVVERYARLRLGEEYLAAYDASRSARQ